jgi:hypothetical protein
MSACAHGHSGRQTQSTGSRSVVPFDFLLKKRNIDNDVAVNAKINPRVGKFPNLSTSLGPSFSVFMLHNKILSNLPERAPEGWHSKIGNHARQVADALAPFSIQT